MPYVRSLEGFAPPKRYDGLPFTQALIQEAATSAGPWTTLETKTLSPVDADPANPATRSFTTALATLAAGWYRILWRDAAAAEFASDAVYFPVTLADLTTRAAVREFLHKNNADTVQDEVIDSLITRASAAIGHEIARFLPAETGSKTFLWRGGPLGLHPYFARTVTAVSLDSDASSPTVLTASDWRLRGKPAGDGVYRWLHFPAYQQFYVVGAVSEVTVTGNWGFASLSEVPADVQHWAIVTVATWLRRDAAAFSTTFRLDDERLERPEALPSAVRAGLAHYRTPEGP